MVEDWHQHGAVAPGGGSGSGPLGVGALLINSDERDVVQGIDFDDEYPTNNDFNVAPCDFSAGNPPYTDPCYGQGGADGNIYGRELR